MAAQSKGHAIPARRASRERLKRDPQRAVPIGGTAAAAANVRDRVLIRDLR
jgi:hypothetical protein